MANINSEKKGIIKAMFIALIITLAGLVILGWQYRQLEEKRLPALEQELEKQKSSMEKRDAEALLEKFIASRINGDEIQAILYLTERAVVQKEEGQFELTDDYLGFKVLDSRETAEGSFIFAVGLYKEGIGEIIEIIAIKKIMGRYYVDSVERAG